MVQSRFDNRHEDFLTAAQAAAFLGVKPATLYTYVSRGRIQAVPGLGRTRRYARSDLERLKAHSDARAGHAAVASGALKWGEPVIDTAISGVDPLKGPIYRGRLALTLAESGIGFEATAEWLWSARPPASPARWDLAGDEVLAALTRSDPREAAGGGLPGIMGDLPRGVPILSALMCLIPALAIRDHGRFGAPPEAEIARARRLIRAMACGLALGREPARVPAAGARGRVAEVVAEALGRPGVEVAEGLERALVLCADHELNVSSFAARVAASSGADLYACVLAALATLSGSRHGGVCDRIEAMVREVGDPDRAAAGVHDRLRRGSRVPGFGQPLYPQGDPRARPLLELARAAGGSRPSVRTLLAIVEAMEAAGHPPPAVDTGLVAVAEAFDLGPGAGAAIFAVGRAAGWIAHTFEQRQDPDLLRPRARYVGAF